MTVIQWMRVAWLTLAFALPCLPAAADLKIGVVDTQSGMNSTEQGQQARKALEKLLEQRQADLKPSQEAYETKVKEFESQKFVLSEAASKDRMLELQKERRELERRAQKAEDEIQVEQQRLTAPIVEKWRRAVEELGRSKGFDVILDTSTPGILYHSKALDVTELIVQSVNKDVTGAAK